MEGKKSFISALMTAGVCPSQMPAAALQDYNIQDINLTHAIFLRQRQLLADAGLLPVFLCRCLMSPVLADIEFNGMQLDETRVTEEFNRIRTEFSISRDQLAAFAPGLNFRSPPQLRAFLYERLGFKELTDRRGNAKTTDKGNKLTGGDTIEALQANSPEQREFKRLFKALSEVKTLEQIITKLKTCVDQDQGRLFATFNQGIAQNHRLTSTGGKYKVQFQNFPRSFKRLFRVSRDNFKFVGADAPQLEFRTSTDLAHDIQGILDICQGVDVHKLTQEVIGYSRDESKPFTFKPLYGGDSGTPKERAYYAAFREKYKDTFNVQTNWTFEVLTNKTLRIPSGLIFYWPDTKLQPSGYITNKASIFNYPVSSFATADIMPLVCWLIWLQIDSTKANIINFIHDEVLSEVKDDYNEEYNKIVIQAFTEQIYDCLERLYNYKFTVPLGVGIKSGSHWGQGEELKINGTPDRIASALQSIGRG